TEIAGRAPTMWRYHELLPVRDQRNVTTLGEGMSPLVPLPRLGSQLDIPRLLMKDEGVLPGGSFKTRGAAAGVSRARELGVAGIAMPTNGNAGAAWALYAARAGLPSLIAMPENAPEITRRECRAAGADLRLVAGHIGDAGKLIATELADRPGYQDVSTLKEPYRIEGKKTMGLEIVEQLGWRTPDVIVYPTGGGVGIIGIHKALGELRELGMLDGPLPRLVAAQAAGCAPIVSAYAEGRSSSEPWPDPHTVAYGINVPKALGDFLILDAVRDTDGCAVAVDDAEILRQQTDCARLEGAFICPEGAAALVAAGQLRADGWIGADEQVVVLNTGTGLKYPETFPT
ncbi:MAG: threonine synthase, partial [Micromonosporaceae bacterium]